jgi:hypothetical protein
MLLGHLPQKIHVPQCDVEVQSVRALVLLRRCQLQLCKDIADSRGEQKPPYCCYNSVVDSYTVHPLQTDCVLQTSYILHSSCSRDQLYVLVTAAPAVGPIRCQLQLCKDIADSRGE